MTDYSTHTVKKLRELFWKAKFVHFNPLSKAELVQLCEKFDTLFAPLTLETLPEGHPLDADKLAEIHDEIQEIRLIKEGKSTSKAPASSAPETKRKRNEDTATEAKKRKVSDEKSKDGAANDPDIEKPQEDTTGLSQTKSTMPHAKSTSTPNPGSPGSSDSDNSDDDNRTPDDRPKDGSEASKDDKKSPKVKRRSPKIGMSGTSPVPQKGASEGELEPHNLHLGTHKVDDYTMKWDPIDESIPDSRLTWFEREQRDSWRKRKACEQAGTPYEERKPEPTKKFNWKEKFLREGI